MEIDLANVHVVESPSAPGVMTSTQNLTGSDTNCWHSSCRRHGAKQRTAEGVNGEVTPPAISRQELGAQHTHYFTLKLTDPLASRIHKHRGRIWAGERKKMNSNSGNFAHEHTALDAALQFHSQGSSSEYNGAL